VLTKFKSRLCVPLGSGKPVPKSHARGRAISSGAEHSRRHEFYMHRLIRLMWLIAGDFTHSFEKNDVTLRDCWRFHSQLRKNHVTSNRVPQKSITLSKSMQCPLHLTTNTWYHHIIPWAGAPSKCMNSKLLWRATVQHLCK